MQNFAKGSQGVLAINGATGIVTLTSANIPEVTNLYFTATRARTSISSTITALTYTSYTGEFSLTTGYVIPTTTQENTWNKKVDAYISIFFDNTDNTKQLQLNIASLAHNQSATLTVKDSATLDQDVSKIAEPTFSGLVFESGGTKFKIDISGGKFKILAYVNGAWDFDNPIFGS